MVPYALTAGGLRWLPRCADSQTYDLRYDGPMTPDAFLKRHPLLFHMAHPGSLESIKRHGLLSTASIVDLLHLSDRDRDRLCSRHRPEIVPLSQKDGGIFYVRDQKPLNPACLARCLEGGITPSAWYRTLNSRTFLWASRSRLEGLKTAKSYRDGSHLILTLSASRLLSRHYAEISVTTFNTGSAIRRAKRRSLASFVPLSGYDPREHGAPIVEVTIPDRIADIGDFILETQVA